MPIGFERPRLCRTVAPVKPNLLDARACLESFAGLETSGASESLGPSDARGHADDRFESEREVGPTLKLGLDWNELEPQGTYAKRVRPVLQMALGASGLILALPLMALIAPINWITFRDVRKILFVQARVGRRGRVFQMVKFRTMRAAMDGSHALASAAAEAGRVTRFGRFLRCTHLDELPQVWNILRGEMSPIGPRAEMVEIEQWARRAVPGFSERLVLRPGLTGLAQVTQGYTDREQEAYREKHRINERYRKNLSLALDLSILARTVMWVLTGSGWRWRSQASRASERDFVRARSQRSKARPPQGSSSKKRRHSRVS